MNASRRASLDIIQFNQLIENTAGVYLEKGQSNPLPSNQQTQIDYDVKKTIEEIKSTKQPVMIMGILLGYIQVKIMENIPSFVENYDTDDMVLNTKLASYTYAVCSAFNKAEPISIGLPSAYKLVLEMLIKHLLSGEWQPLSFIDNQIMEDDDNINYSQQELSTYLNASKVALDTAGATKELTTEIAKHTFAHWNWGSGERDFEIFIAGFTQDIVLTAGEKWNNLQNVAYFPTLAQGSTLCLLFQQAYACETTSTR